MKSHISTITLGVNDSNISNKQFSDANQEFVEYDGSPLSWRVSAYA